MIDILEPVDIPLWNPTDAQYKKFQDREVELCRINMRSIPINARNNVTVARLYLLHSEQIIKAAMK